MTAGTSPIPSHRIRTPSRRSVPSAGRAAVTLARETAAEDSRRTLNLFLAAVSLALLAPLMVVIAIAVKMSSRGPIFYRQTRVGVDRRRDTGADYDCRRAADIGGTPFEIYKFRTMRVDAERECGAVWARHDDPRITLVGAILRKTRLDELPQLFNVIKGDMNIVGPRPERPSIFATLRREIDGYQTRQRTLPGITGLAQINQAYDTSVDDVRRKVAYDLEYITTRPTATDDLLIMIKTVPVMLFRRGAR